MKSTKLKIKIFIFLKNLDNEKRIFLILSPIRETYPENYEGMIVFLGNKDHQYIKEKSQKLLLRI